MPRRSAASAAEAEAASRRGLLLGVVVVGLGVGLFLLAAGGRELALARATHATQRGPSSAAAPSAPSSGSAADAGGGEAPPQLLFGVLPTSVGAAGVAVEQLRATTAAAPAWALPAAFAGAYVLKQAFCLPLSPVLNALAGGLFGLVHGAVVVWGASVLGACVCFAGTVLLGDTVVASRVAPRARDALRKRVASLAAAEQLAALVLMRAVPGAPHTALNLLLALCDVPFERFAASVAVGMIPYTLVTVQAGATVAAAAGGDGFSPSSIYGFVAGLGLMGLAAAAMRRRDPDAAGALAAVKGKESDTEGVGDVEDSASSAGAAVGRGSRGRKLVGRSKSPSSRRSRA